jgi:hypothetical protein
MLDGEEVSCSAFAKALRARIYDPDEACWIATSHRSQAAEARSAVPHSIVTYDDQCSVAGLESRAAAHDRLAAVCEHHASLLRRCISNKGRAA